MLNPEWLPKLEGLEALVEGVHKLSDGTLCGFRVSVDGVERLSPTLTAIASEVGFLALKLHKVSNYRRRLVDIGRRHGVYPVTHEVGGSVVHRFSEDGASVSLRLQFRKIRGKTLAGSDLKFSESL